MTSRRPSSVVRAFTLIELLVVVGIIAVLMGIAIAVGHHVQDNGKAKSTKDLLLALDQIYIAAKNGNGGQNLPPVVADPRLYSNRNDKAALAWLPVADARIDVNAGLARFPIINSVGLFLWQARQYPEAAKLIEALPSKQVKVLELDDAEANTPTQPSDLKGQPPLATALDAWGHPIRYVHPAFDGQILDSSGQPNSYKLVEDILPGTIVTPAAYLFPKVRRNAFVQPGDQTTDPSLAADSDGGTCVAGHPYFYSAGPDGDPSTIEDNVYTTLPTLPKKK